jgi:hypothetical protein
MVADHKKDITKYRTEAKKSDAARKYAAETASDAAEAS